MDRTQALPTLAGEGAAALAGCVDGDNDGQDPSVDSIPQPEGLGTAPPFHQPRLHTPGAALDEAVDAADEIQEAAGSIVGPWIDDVEAGGDAARETVETVTPPSEPPLNA